MVGTNRLGNIVAGRCEPSDAASREADGRDPDRSAHAKVKLRIRKDRQGRSAGLSGPRVTIMRAIVVACCMLVGGSIFERMPRLELLPFRYRD